MRPLEEYATDIYVEWEIGLQLEILFMKNIKLTSSFLSNLVSVGYVTFYCVPHTLSLTERTFTLACSRPLCFLNVGSFLRIRTLSYYRNFANI